MEVYPIITRLAILLGCTVYGSVENQWGNKFFTAKDYSELCAMENDYLQMLAQIVLPSQILD
ncbi:hypothetical protein EEL35_06045, partial [Muribaculaceae bacterium Isolate-042 (Harlan)]